MLFLNSKYLLLSYKIIVDGMINEKGISVTEKKEYRLLKNIKDNYPKYVLTLDYLLQQRDGIKHKNIIKFMIEHILFK